MYAIRSYYDTFTGVNQVRGSDYGDTLLGGNPATDGFEGYDGVITSYSIHYTKLYEEYESKWFPALQQMVGKEYLDPEASHLTHRPIPTCLRNHCIIQEVNAGRGPIHT